MSDEILEAFASESREILDGFEDSVRDLGSGVAGSIDTLFRLVHTLKGSAGIVGLDHLELFAHSLETRLGLLRKAGVMAIDEPIKTMLLASRDRIASILTEEPATIGADSAGADGVNAEGLGPEAALSAEDLGLFVSLDAALSALVPVDELAVQSGPGSDAHPASPPQPAPSLATASSQQASASSRPPADGFARVSSAKLEHILSLSSEMAVALSNLGQSVRATGNPQLLDEVAALEALAASLYKNILDTRMIPFGDIAERFRRAVDEIARATGKRIRFELEGEDTEIEKSLADRLAEPLLHLIRNAADHGIEAADRRAAIGKAEEGRVTLSARRESGLLTIAVEDDGAGIEPEAVRRRAVEAGLLEPDATPVDDELMALLFEPGFSLSGEVTRWSGRGVGLDVVKKSVAKLRGSVRLFSHPGLGSIARIRVPLSLSLVEGFVARVGETSVLVPFDATASCLELPEESFATSSGEAARTRADAFGTLTLDGRIVPSIDLRLLYDEDRPQGEDRRFAVLLDSGGEETGLIVDGVGETLQAAVRPLDRRLADSPGVAGYAVRGDGSLMLVVDASELSQLASRHEAALRKGR
jgi:two-component system chemotaxis sensor kinase CheA